MPKMEGGEKRRVFDFRAQPICQNVVESVPVRCGELEGNGDRKSRVALFSFGV